MKITGTWDDGTETTFDITIGQSVELMECKYECGGLIAVTTRKRKPPHHLECAIRAAIECQAQMHAKSGPYYKRWQDAVNVSADKWVAGCHNAALRYAASANRS